MRRFHELSCQYTHLNGQCWLSMNLAMDTTSQQLDMLTPRCDIFDWLRWRLEVRADYKDIGTRRD